MTTSQFTSPYDCDTDAHFRAWGSEISAQLAAVGLTKTADTGQIDWTTASIAGYPGAVGYEIWRFNDALQATTPIFFKLEYGAQGVSTPSLAFTVGSGSDGAGSITGALKSNRDTSTGTTILGNAYPSYICYRPTDGFLGVALKIGQASQPGYANGFAISRTNDTSGAVTGDAVNVMWCSGPGGNTHMYVMAPGAAVKLPLSGNFSTASSWLASWPLALTSSFAGGSIQAAPVFALAPAIQVNAKICAVVHSEVPTGSTFSLNVVGLTARTFVSIGNAFGTFVNNADANYGAAMLWE